MGPKELTENDLTNQTIPFSIETGSVTLANTQVEYAYNMNAIGLDGFPPCSLSGFKTCPLPAHSVQ